MNGTWVGGLLGLLAAMGVIVAVRAAPPMRRVRLEDRIAPYLTDAPLPSRLLAQPSATSAPFVVVRRLMGPVVGDAVRLLDRLVGGSASVRRRLGGLGDPTTLEEFRIEQVVWGAVGLLSGGLGLTVLTFVRGTPTRCWPAWPLSSGWLRACWAATGGCRTGSPSAMRRC